MVLKFTVTNQEENIYEVLQHFITLFYSSGNLILFARDVFLLLLADDAMFNDCYIYERVRQHTIAPKQ